MSRGKMGAVIAHLAQVYTHRRHEILLTMYPHPSMAMPILLRRLSVPFLHRETTRDRLKTVTKLQVYGIILLPVMQPHRVRQGSRQAESAAAILQSRSQRVGRRLGRQLLTYGDELLTRKSEKKSEVVKIERFVSFSFKAAENSFAVLSSEAKPRVFVSEPLALSCPVVLPLRVIIPFTSAYLYGVRFI